MDGPLRDKPAAFSPACSMLLSVGPGLTSIALSWFTYCIIMVRVDWEVMAGGDGCGGVVGVVAMICANSLSKSTIFQNLRSLQMD